MQILFKFSKVLLVLPVFSFILLISKTPDEILDDMRERDKKCCKLKNFHGDLPISVCATKNTLFSKKIKGEPFVAKDIPFELLWSQRTDDCAKVVESFASEIGVSVQRFDANQLFEKSVKENISATELLEDIYEKAEKEGQEKKMPVIILIENLQVFYESGAEWLSDLPEKKLEFSSAFMALFDLYTNPSYPKHKKNTYCYTFLTVNYPWHMIKPLQSRFGGSEIKLPGIRERISTIQDEIKFPHKISKLALVFAGFTTMLWSRTRLEKSVKEVVEYTKNQKRNSLSPIDLNKKLWEKGNLISRINQLFLAGGVVVTAAVTSIFILKKIPIFIRKILYNPKVNIENPSQKIKVKSENGKFIKI